jgi:hypothetical protein
LHKMRGNTLSGLFRFRRHRHVAHRYYHHRQFRLVPPPPHLHRHSSLIPPIPPPLGRANFAAALRDPLARVAACTRLSMQRLAAATHTGASSPAPSTLPSSPSLRAEIRAARVEMAGAVDGARGQLLARCVAFGERAAAGRAGEGEDKCKIARV